MDGTTAYKTAYDTKASDKVCNNESRVLLMRDDITERIAELRKPLINHAQNNALNERQRHIDEIRERIEICKEKQDEQSLIRYYDMICKIYGHYKETESDQKTENTVTGLDTATLVKLSGTA
jgi:hypothetical protein